MQRPPSGKGLPLAPASPIHDALNRISGKQTELIKLGLSPARLTALMEFVERAFTASALALTGLDVSDEQIAVLQRGRVQEAEALPGTEGKIQAGLTSVRVLRSVADRAAAASLTPELLLRIHDPLNDKPSGNNESDTAADGAEESARTAARIMAFCDWAAADSFRELNALEQAAIIVLRLLEIRPFAEGNVIAALGAGSLFTMRAGWPPIIIPKPIQPRFKPTVGEGMKMNTRPMVDLLAESIYQTIESIIQLAKAGADRR